MGIGTDDSRADGSRLVTSREPVGPSDKDETAGTVALRDALWMVAIAWAVLFFLVFSLRSHNV